MVPFFWCLTAWYIPFGAGQSATNHSLDDFDRERYLGTDCLNGHLRHLFINSAMDEALARAIFPTVLSAKDMHRFTPSPAGQKNGSRAERVCGSPSPHTTIVHWHDISSYKHDLRQALLAIKRDDEDEFKARKAAIFQSVKMR
ncbi:hypothetical protein B0H67DRAFT_549793 [Lasiosphaeris hirsuta]|uniref:Uncharacterized protein n=1 Tax=Lasiosphaeris hirsuta TaxID=260670 RepID=A0AA40BDE6_9PEZI|nr:hypothetical protein B0H67DRAFT_549793 [Lasiosphaeris hirsuta]